MGDGQGEAQGKGKAGGEEDRQEDTLVGCPALCSAYLTNAVRLICTSARALTTLSCVQCQLSKMQQLAGVNLLGIMSNPNSAG